MYLNKSQVCNFSTELCLRLELFCLRTLIDMLTAVSKTHCGSLLHSLLVIGFQLYIHRGI